jgi:hypothetical protein
MGLFVRLIKQIVSQIKINVSSGPETMVEAEITLNTLVTSLHIVLIITYTVLNFLEEIYYPKMSISTVKRVVETYYFVTGGLDIFVAYIIWFMLDD